MSSAARYTPHYTVEDYRGWEGDWKFWDGTAVAMPPSPFGPHGAMLARRVGAIANSIDSSVQLLWLSEDKEYISVPVDETANVKVCRNCQLEIDLGWRFG